MAPIKGKHYPRQGEWGVGHPRFSPEERLRRARWAGTHGGDFTPETSRTRGHANRGHRSGRRVPLTPAQLDAIEQRLKQKAK